MTVCNVTDICKLAVILNVGSLSNKFLHSITLTTCSNMFKIYCCVCAVASLCTERISQPNLNSFPFLSHLPIKLTVLTSTNPSLRKWPCWSLFFMYQLHQLQSSSRRRVTLPDVTDGISVIANFWSWFLAVFFLLQRLIDMKKYDKKLYENVEDLNV